MDPEAAYKISGEEFVSFFKNLSNVTFNFTDANHSGTENNFSKIFAGPLSSQGVGVGQKLYTKVVDSRKVGVYVFDNNGTYGFEGESEVPYSPYSYTNAIQFEYGFFLNVFAGISDSGNSEPGLYSPDDFGEKLGALYAKYPIAQPCMLIRQRWMA